jgi:hypothetical protein
LFSQDACKVLLHKVMVAGNWFGYNESGKLVMPESAKEWAKLNFGPEHEKELK